MRTYYLFSIDKLFSQIYREKSSLLFLNFYQIYKNNNRYDDLISGAYIQLINHINKRNLNEYIYIRHKDQLSYFFYDDCHIIENVYNNEITKLIINNTFIKIITNVDYPCFFSILDSYFNDIFICD
ncbi:MAG: hypothetical protein PHS45_04760, partial [Bacilli bacterium]|nr:hypothetical protein [Bacilli bacterium]